MSAATELENTYRILVRDMINDFNKSSLQEISNAAASRCQILEQCAMRCNDLRDARYCIQSANKFRDLYRAIEILLYSKPVE